MDRIEVCGTSDGCSTQPGSTLKTVNDPDKIGRVLQFFISSKNRALPRRVNNDDFNW